MAASGSKPPKSYWIISIAALLWNVIGMVLYVSVVTMAPEVLDAMTPEERGLYTSIPAWATGANGLAVTAGVIGSILLLLRNSWAVPTFLVSLAAVLVQMYHAFFIAHALEVLGPAGMVMPVTVIIIAVFQVVLAARARVNRWTT